MVNINISRLNRKNFPNILEFVNPTNTVKGKGENFAFNFEAADERCYIAVRNNDSKTVVCGFFDPETQKTPDQTSVLAGSTAIIPIESAWINKDGSTIIFNLSPGSTLDALCDLDVGIAGFQSGIITH